MKVHVEGMMETTDTINFFIIPESDATLQVTDDIIQIWFGQSMVGKITFRDKRELNFFFKNLGIEMRGRRTTS